MNRIATENDSDLFRETGIKLRDIRNALGLDYIPIGKPVHSSRELHVGQIIAVAKEKGKKPNWIPMVLREIDETYLYIARKSTSSIVNFDDGEKIQCKLWRDEDAEYKFPSRIVFHGESHAEWRLSHNTGKMNRAQSREHFRMRYEQSTNVGVLNASANEDPDYIKRRRSVTKLRGKITSLSAGGCAVVFQQPIASQVFLRIEIELPDHPPFSLEAKIVATSNISGGRSLVRTRFIASTQEERDLISKFLRQRQQETMLPDTP
jgi:c-di-GMP-binding flagellar brake protein YcgR